MNKDVLLIDVDGKNPNLALMKISRYYKEQGYNITLKRLELNYYRKSEKIEIDALGYFKVFVSIIFPINKNTVFVKNCNSVEYGGTGYSLTKKLPIEIYNSLPDYSIYPENDISYGFITRGCIRNCYFCFVPKKEGKLRLDTPIDNIIQHKKVKFMDNNFLAYDKHKDIFKQLNNREIKYQFNQALDIRLIDDENARLLSEANYLGEYTFSFDDIKYRIIVEEKVGILKRYIPKDWRIKMFIYVNPNMEIHDTIKRIEWCREKKILPYIMRDKSCWKSENKEFYIDISSYCNQPNIFKKMTFKEFIIRRTKNIDRQNKGILLYTLDPQKMPEELK